MELFALNRETLFARLNDVRTVNYTSWHQYAFARAMALAQSVSACNVHVMSRHTSPNKRRIDDAFPIRVKIRIPPGGLGNQLSEIHSWIRNNLGPELCQHFSTRGVHCQATAYYFRTMEDAESFLAAFPELALADGVNDQAPLGVQK